MTLTVLSPAPSRAGRRNHYRCECGAEFTARASDVARGAIKSCGCLNKRFANRRRSLDVPAIAVRFVPASPWMRDDVLCDALVALLRPPFGRLPYVAPTSVARICRELGCEPHHVLRAPLNVALEWDCEGERLWGRGIAAGDLFGPRAPEAVREREAA